MEENVTLWIRSWSVNEYTYHSSAVDADDDGWWMPKICLNTMEYFKLCNQIKVWKRTKKKSKTNRIGKSNRRESWSTHALSWKFTRNSSHDYNLQVSLFGRILLLLFSVAVAVVVGIWSKESRFYLCVNKVYMSDVDVDAFICYIV